MVGLAVGSRVAFVAKSTSPVTLRSGAEAHGTLAYIGCCEFGKGEWAGVHLDDPVGKTDGQVNGTRYFTCPQGHGIFCRPIRLRELPRAEDRAKIAVAGPGQSQIRLCHLAPSISQFPSPVPSSPLSAYTTPPPNTSSLWSPGGGSCSAGAATGHSLGTTAVSDGVMCPGSTDVAPVSPARSDNQRACVLQKLREASEDHDIGTLRVVLPIAETLGAPLGELESARSVLDFETRRHSLTHPVHMDEEDDEALRLFAGGARQIIAGSSRGLRALEQRVQALELEPVGPACVQGVAAKSNWAGLCENGKLGKQVTEVSQVLVGVSARLQQQEDQLSAHASRFKNQEEQMALLRVAISGLSQQENSKVQDDVSARLQHLEEELMVFDNVLARVRKLGDELSVLDVSARLQKLEGQAAALYDIPTKVHKNTDDLLALRSVSAHDEQILSELRGSVRSLQKLDDEWFALDISARLQQVEEKLMVLSDIPARLAKHDNELMRLRHMCVGDGDIFSELSGSVRSVQKLGDQLSALDVSTRLRQLEEMTAALNDITARTQKHDNELSALGSLSDGKLISEIERSVKSLEDDNLRCKRRLAELALESAQVKKLMNEFREILPNQIKHVTMAAHTKSTITAVPAEARENIGNAAWRPGQQEKPPIAGVSGSSVTQKASKLLVEGLRSGESVVLAEQMEEDARKREEGGDSQGSGCLHRRMTPLNMGTRYHHASTAGRQNFARRSTVIRVLDPSRKLVPELGSDYVFAKPEIDRSFAQKVTELLQNRAGDQSTIDMELSKLICMTIYSRRCKKTCIKFGTRTICEDSRA